MPVRRLAIITALLFSLVGSNAIAQSVLELGHNPRVQPPIPMLRPATDWAFLADAIETRVEGHSAVLNGNIYVFGGFQTQNMLPTDQNEFYNPANDAWTSFEPLPVPNTHVGSAKVDGKVWIAGGFALIEFIQTVDLVWIYDPVTNTFSDGPPLPEPRAGGALVRLGRNLHFISGLENRNDSVGDHFVLDLEEPGGPKTWTMLAPLPDPRNHLSGIALGGKIYAIGGQFNHDTDPQDTNLLHAYDPETDDWTRLADLPNARSHFEPGTFVLDGKIVIAGGRSGDQNCIDDVTRYDPATNTWSELFTLPECLLAPSVKVIGEEMFLSHGGKISILFPTNAAWKRDIDRIHNRTLAFSPAGHAINLAAGESGVIESIIWTLSDIASFSINAADLPSWITGISKTSGAADTAGEKVSLTLNATGLAPGVYMHTLVASASAYDNASLTVELTVTGDGQPLLVIEPTNADLGEIPLGYTTEQTFILTNAGNAAGTVDAFDVTWTGKADVRFDDLTSTTLMPGESVSFTGRVTQFREEDIPTSASIVYSGNNFEQTLDFSMPSTGKGTKVIRINAGGDYLIPGVFADWDADTHVEGGTMFSSPEGSVIEGTSDPLPYQTQRVALNGEDGFVYRIPVPTQGNYITRLHFAELYYGASEDEGDFIGQRVFDVNIERGSVELNDYDITADVGTRKAVTKSYVTEVLDGELEIRFKPVVSQPVVSGIEVHMMDPFAHQPLEEGWNLVGLSFLPPELNAYSVFSETTLNQLPYALAGDRYESRETLELNEAYWVDVVSPAIHKLHGVFVDTEGSFSFVEAGWNLISAPPCLFPVAFTMTSSHLLTGYKTPYGYTKNNGYETTQILLPGKGYWMDISAPGWLDFNCLHTTGPDSQKSTFRTTALASVPLEATITLTDPTGISRSLKVAAGIEENTPRLSLPPVLNDDMPDVRFNDNTNLMTGDKSVIKIQGMKAPITVSLKSSDPELTYQLQVENGETLGSTVVLSADKEVVFEEPDLRFLSISKEAPQEAALPNAFQLLGVYPNPFRTTATVTFYLPEDGLAHVELYDMLGRRVLQTPRQTVNAGSGRVIDIDGQNLASGNYLYRMVIRTTTGEQNATGLLVLTK